MKVFQVIQKPQLRGAEIFAAQLASHLQILGHECKLIAIFPGQETLPFGGELIKLDRPHSRRVFDWHGWKIFAELIEREKPDIIQMNAGDSLKFAVLSKLFFCWKTPLVFRNASMPGLYVRNWFVRVFNSVLYRSVTAIASVSSTSKEDLNSIFPETVSKSVVIPVGIDIDVLPTPVDKGSYPTFIHVGGFTFEKNHKGLINIFEKLRQRFSASQLWLIGDGPLRAEIESMVRMKGLQECVNFFGFVKDPRRYMLSADVLLMSSVIEGLPAVIIEAMHCRCPVVAYNAGGICEIVKHQTTGFLVPLHNEAEFVEAVSFCLNNDESMKQIKDSAVDFVRKFFDNKQIASRFVELYEKTLNAQKE